MSRDKQIDIPESEMGMSGYSTFAWKLWEKGLCTMAEAEQADQIMRQLGYRKASDVASEIFEEIVKYGWNWIGILDRLLGDGIDTEFNAGSRNAYMRLIDFLAMLKKKYTEGEG